MYAKKFQDEVDAKSRSDITIVNIPKDTLQFVNVGTYRFSESMDHMPLVRIMKTNVNFRAMFKAI